MIVNKKIQKSNLYKTNTTEIIAKKKLKENVNDKFLDIVNNTKNIEN